MSQTVDILPTIAETLGLERAYKMKGMPLSQVPDDRDVEVSGNRGKAFRITRSSADRFLEGSGQARAQRLGTRNLRALGHRAGRFGSKAPRSKRPNRPKLTIAGLAKLRKKPSDVLRPALVEGFVTRGPSAKELSNGTRLLLALDGRFVSSAAIYPIGKRKAFAFLIHQSFLGKGGLGKPQIFRVLPSGKTVRIY